MCIDVSSDIEVTVSQPLLYALERYSASYKQTCAAVPEIMEPDLLETMLCQELRELTTQIVRSDKISHLINEYIAVIIVVIAITTDALVIFLSFCFCLFSAVNSHIFVPVVFLSAEHIHYVIVAEQSEVVQVNSDIESERLPKPAVPVRVAE